MDENSLSWAVEFLVQTAKLYRKTFHMCQLHQNKVAGFFLIMVGLLFCIGSVATGKPEGSASRGQLIEAEHFDARSPGEKPFAKVFLDRAASGGAGLTRFFRAERHCTYDLEVNTSGTYHVWVRYSSKTSTELRMEVNPGTDEQDHTKELSRTPGGLKGPGVWAWERLLTVSLKDGAHKLRLHSAPLRLDCIYLTRESTPPPSLQELASLNLSETTRKQLKKSRVPVVPDWLRNDRVLNYRLPDWYDDHRVHAHTRLSPRYRGKELFLNAAQRFKELGFRAFVRHIKSGSEGAWWPSEVGKVAPWAEGTNYAKKIMNNAREAGRHLIVYHRHMEDRYMAEQHPSWVTRGPNGTPYRRRGRILCLNSPYADYVLKRMIELGEMGAEGFYYDSFHVRPGGCWCPHTKNAFREKTGLDTPERRNPHDPVYQRYLDFKNLTIETTFLEWRQALHERFPDLVMLISSYKYPGMVSQHTTHRLYRITDSVKTEFDKPLHFRKRQIFRTDPELARPERHAALVLGYSLARDAADGRPPHVWVNNIGGPVQATYATAGLITHGAIANLDNNESRIPNHDYFDRAVRLGNQVSPAFDEARPLRWAAVHFSERARNHYFPDEKTAWKEVLYPVYGAFTTLLKEHRPVGLVTDSQLAQGRLTGYDVLFLPAPEHLTASMQAAVEQFEANGGLVVRQRDAWRWHQPDGGITRAGAELTEQIRSSAKAAPVHVTGGHPKMHSVPFVTKDRRRLTVSLANDFSWVRESPDKQGKDWSEVVERRKPEPCRNVSIHVRGWKEPKRVYNAVTGKSLEVQKTDRGVRIDVPLFEVMAVVVLER